MLNTESVLKTLSNPDSTLGSLPANELSDLRWFISLMKKQYYSLGYFVDRESVNKMNFPAIDFFSSNNDTSTDIFNLYSAFAWRGFMHYCQPGVDKVHGILEEFQYRGNQRLDAETTGYMLRFPSSDWLDALLELNSITPTPEIGELIEKNKLVSARSICADFKHVQSRLYALMYMLDHMAFLHRYYDKDLNSQKELVTRSPELIRFFLGADAEDFIEALYNVDLFDTPITGSVLVVNINLNREGGTICNPIGELTYIDTNDRFSRFLPLFEYMSYADGISDRIKDMPNGAASLLLDFKKTGLTIRYATLNKDVMKQMYADTCMMKVNTRSRIDLGLDIFDEFGFKYWNLQSSIDAARNYSAFNLFSLYGISSCNLTELSQGILSADYQLVKNKFKKAVQDASATKLAEFAELCGIKPDRPRLKGAILDWGEKHHASEVYNLMERNKQLFN